VACGTGIVARRVAVHVESNAKIVGLDLNPHMLTVARAAANPYPRIDSSVASGKHCARQYPLKIHIATILRP
jgi:hypothetical protein